MKYILTSNNVVIIWGDKVESGRWENDETMDTYRITQNGTYLYAVIPGFEVKEVDSLPEDFQEIKYCYTDEKGFYLNPDWSDEAPTSESTTEERLTVAEAKLAALTETNSFLEECLVEMAEKVYE